ncbi:MAG: hypothetical protein HWQ38_21520 [Nostoc sp. NMS7]|nr:hypothetical protein [Nostoc sp. NMS7]MBN3948899.1 hypothetical protein [Nostoc sp. NMS7]
MVFNDALDAHIKFVCRKKSSFLPLSNFVSDAYAVRSCGTNQKTAIAYEQ